MSHPPPVPPANRTNKGPATQPTEPGSPAKTHKQEHLNNLAEQDQQGNIKQNTTTGHQQDR